MAMQFLAAPGGPNNNDRGSSSNLSVSGRNEESKQVSLRLPLLKKKKKRRSYRKKSSSNSIGDEPTFRYYFSDIKTFKELLALYNLGSEEQFECVGDVKVGMQMCTRCRDLGKNKQYTDKYYIKKEEAAKKSPF